MPSSVIIYNRDLEKVAYLQNAEGVGYTKQKDELWTAQFSLPADDPKNDDCQELYYAEIFDGDERVDLFRIVIKEKVRSGGVPMVNYQCKHVLSTLNDDELIGVHNAGPGVTAGLNYILGRQAVARWQLGTVEFTQNFWHCWEDISLLKALYTISSRFLADHIWTWDTATYPWTLNLLEAPSEVSARISYRLNMQKVSRKSDARNLYTRLYAYGYGAGADQLDLGGIDQAAAGRPGFTSGSVEFTVNEVLTGADSGATATVRAYHKVAGEWDGDAEGVLFLDDIAGDFADGESLNGSVGGANMAALDSSLECVYAEAVVRYGVITRVWEDQRYTVPEHLYEAAEKRVDENSVPDLTYTMKAADLYRLVKVHKLELGDLDRIHDGPLGIDVDARIVTVAKRDVQGKPGDIDIQLGNKVDKFPDFGGIVYADDLDGVKDGATYGKVLSTQILAGKILLSAVPGGPIGSLPAPPEIAGLYLSAEYLGYHDGSDWITYMDNAGKLYCEGIGADAAHFRWNPVAGGSLDIKSANVDIQGKVTITSGSGIANLDDAGDLVLLDVVGNAHITDLAVDKLTAGELTVELSLATGGIVKSSNYVPGTTGWAIKPDGTAEFQGTIVCANLSVTGGTWGGDVLAAAKIPNLDCDKITSGTFGTVRIPSLDCDKITSGTFGAVRIPELSCDKITSGTFSAVRIPSLDCDKITSGTFGVVRIPNLDCDKITSGTFGVVRIPNLSCDKITSGTFDPVLIPDLAFSKITAATNTASLVIGGAGSIKSSNYAAGSAGFIIKGNGDAEFNAVTVRGALIAGAGSSISGAYLSNVNADTITAGTLTGRTFQTASGTGNRVIIAALGTDAHRVQVKNAANAVKVQLQADDTTAPPLFLSENSAAGGLIYISGADKGSVPFTWNSEKSFLVWFGAWYRLPVYAL